MKYVVDVHGQRVEVVLHDGEVRVGDQSFDAHIVNVDGTPVQMLTIGRSVYRVVVERGAVRGSYVLWIDGWRFPIEALDERTRAIRDAAAVSAAAAGPAPLVAPMPGLIVRVLVDEGAEVTAGQPLVVMEAMKMENELRSPSSGRVVAVKVKPGAAVEKGAELIALG
jgi:pyruvate carboxylase subunit B